jgi:hypothetical protein
LNGKLNSPSSLTKAIKLAPESILTYLNDKLKNNPNWEKIGYLVKAICSNFELKTCKICNKQLTYSKSKENDYCSKRCVQLDKEIRAKIEESCIEKYGVKSPTMNLDILEKRKQNNLKKYGVADPISLTEIQNKRQQTCQEKFGGNSPACSNIVREKMKETCSQRYGKSYSSQVDSIKQKTIKTFRKNKFQSFNKFKDFVIPQFTEVEYVENKTNDLFQWKCVKCGNVFEQQGIYTTGHLKTQHISLLECPRCLHCYPLIQGYSKSEKELVEFCKQYYPDLKENDRTLIRT